ncbi:hypothetical protein LCGC14_1331070, partial [marine sediment metagenome]
FQSGVKADPRLLQQEVKRRAK